MAHCEAREGVAAARIKLERFAIERDRFVVIAVGVLIDRLVAQFLGLRVIFFVIGHTISPADFTV
jgi:hypothetical protein